MFSLTNKITKSIINIDSTKTKRKVKEPQLNPITTIVSYTINNIQTNKPEILLTIIDLLTIAISELYCNHTYASKHIKCDKPFFYHGIESILSCKNKQPIIKPLIKQNNDTTNNIIINHIIPNIKEACDHYNLIVNLLSNSVQTLPTYEIINNTLQPISTTPLYYMNVLSSILPKLKTIELVYNNITSIVDNLKILGDMVETSATLFYDMHTGINIVYYLVKYYNYEITDKTTFIPKNVQISELNNIIMNKTYNLFVFNIITC